MSENTKGEINRRTFLRTAGVTAAGITILPSQSVFGLGHPAPTNKLNIAAVGVGGVGFRNLNNLSNENIVALCDVDNAYSLKAARRWTAARRYTDYRQMLEQEKNIDAVLVATPDHSHAVIAAAALQLQKHVFVQAPLAHSVYEVRKLVELADLYGTATQVGNQVASSDQTRFISELIASGTLGEVSEIHAWTNQSNWQQSQFQPERRTKTPSDLNWDLYTAPGSTYEYNPSIAPTGWRGLWNFGNGVLGSMAPHVLEPAFRALKLGAPEEVEASSTFTNLQLAPEASLLTFRFARRDNLPKVAMPAVTLKWYDGGLKPQHTNELPSNFQISKVDTGILFRGSEGALIYDVDAGTVHTFINREEMDVELPKTFARIEKPFEGGHETDWVRACKEAPENRLETSAPFRTQQALSETILVGSLALRFQSLQQKLIWNSAQMRFDNIGTNDELFFYPRKKLANEELKGTSSNALHLCDRLIRPLYRTGWKL
jgi:predicted dehydrogenase